VDVSNRDAVFAFAEDVRRTHGRCELVFNIAGVASSCGFDQVDMEEIDKVMAINLGGTIHTAKAFLPLLKNCDRAGLVTMSSIGGILACPGSSAYCLSKFAIRGLSESLLLESAELYPRVQISCVYPGLIQNSFLANSSVHMLDSGIRVMGSKRPFVAMKDIDRALRLVGSTNPRDAATQIIDGIRSGRNRILVGSDVKILDLVVRAFPSLLYQPWIFKIVLIITILVTRLCGRRVVFAATISAFVYLYSREFARIAKSSSSNMR